MAPNQRCLPAGMVARGAASVRRVNITLREITEENADSVLALRTTPDQERFVSSENYSLADAAANPQGNPWFLWKLLIDHRHQRKGYGQEVVRQIVELVRGQGATELLTSHVPGDGGPAGFYARLGFVPTGELDPEGEVILRRIVRD